MTPSESRALGAELQATAGIFGRRLSEDVATAYLHALDDLAYEPLRRVLRQLARGGEGGEHFPTPAELRRRVGGGSGRPDAPLDAVAFGRVRQAIWEALARWEETDGRGSARPHFEAAWLEGRRREGGAGTVRQREVLWQAWLQAPSREEEQHA